MKKVIGIVSEGPTDYLVLKAVIDKITGEENRYLPLQPEPDMLGRYENWLANGYVLGDIAINSTTGVVENGEVSVTSGVVVDTEVVTYKAKLMAILVLFLKAQLLLKAMISILSLQLLAMLLLK